MLLVRILFGLAFCLPAWAGLPHLQLSQSVPEVNLSTGMALSELPLQTPVDPDLLWAAPVAPWRSGAFADRWEVRPGVRTVGRGILQGGPEKGIYVLEVPVMHLDHVRVWYREPGKPWLSAEAGDRVPLSRWPFISQFPAFPIAMTEALQELIVTAVNDGELSVPVWIKSDPYYRERRLLQAQLIGVVMGLGFMGAVVSLISAVTIRARASWVLFAYASWALVWVGCMSGQMAIWLTPEWPAFNDASQHFSGVVMAGLLVAVVVEVLDRIDFRPWLSVLGAAAVLSALVYGAAQASVLPGPWRTMGSTVWALVCTAIAGALCLTSALRGGRYAGFIGLGTAAFAMAMALGYADVDLVRGLDLRVAAQAILLFGSALLFRNALFLRERNGRDVLGRAALSANRDPLTALLSYDGFQQSHAEATLRESVGQGVASMMLLQLPGLERSGEDHGFVLTERALVRFAAALQAVLGHQWAIGRLSKARFAAISLRPKNAGALIETATQVLSRCTRLAQPLNPVSDFDLRIVCRHRSLAAVTFEDLLRELEEAGRALEPGKRITLL